MGCHSLLQRIFPARDWNHAFCIRALTGEFFTTSTTWEAPQSTMSCVVLFLVTQSYPTLCNPMDCSQPGFSVRGDSPGNNTWVGCHALLQGDLPNPWIERSSPTLQGGLFTIWATREAQEHSSSILNTQYSSSLSLLQRNFLTRNQTMVPALQVDSLPAELPGKPL